MNKLVLAVALCSALAACDDAAEESDDPAPAAGVAAQSWAGTYTFEIDGQPTSSVLMADGMYSDIQGGKVIETGRWEERDGKVCFDPDDDTPVSCVTPGEMAEDGTMTVTPDEGEPLTVRKVG